MGAIQLPKGYLAMSRDIFGFHDYGSTTGIYQVEDKDDAKHPTKHKTTLYNKKLSGPIY